MKEKIVLPLTVEVELNERERAIYAAGYKRALDYFTSWHGEIWEQHVRGAKNEYERLLQEAA